MANDWVIAGDDLADAPIELVGGKALGVGALIAAGAPVPPGFCLTTAAQWAARHQPEAVDATVLAAVQRLRAAGVRRFAVRSSHVAEDGAEVGAPGVYHSEVGPAGDAELLAAVRRVWDSAAHPAATGYLRQRGVASHRPGMAVLIQQAPVAVAGGVVYTMLPGDDDPSALLVEYAAGPPENVTDSHTSPYRCVVSKRTLRPDPAEPELLSSDQLQVLVTWSLRVERRLDAPLDLEWLLTDKGEVRMLQARRLAYPRVTGVGPYTAVATDAALRSDKLAPFRLAGKAGVNTVPAYVILPAAFQAFADASGVSPVPVHMACRRVFERFCRTGPVSLRSAYWSALDSGDMLPQSPPFTTVDEGMTYLETYWRHVLGSGRADYSAQVALLVSNWVSPRASVLATTGAGADPVVIGALYGQMEGLETCAHDTYQVDPRTLEVLAALVPRKPRAVFARDRPPEAVPARLQDRAVLTADELRAVTRSTAALSAEAGPARVELLVRDGSAPADQRVVAWQFAPQQTSALRYYRVRRSGSVDRPASLDAERAPVAAGRLVRLHTPADIGRVEADPDGTIIGLDFERFVLRDAELASDLAGRLQRAGRPVVLKGSILSHFAALLREYGVAVYPVSELAPIPAGAPVEVVAA